MTAPAMSGSRSRELVDELIDALVCLLVCVDLADAGGLDDAIYLDAKRKARAALRRVRDERPSYPLGRGSLS